jgi:hypothetical protein
MYAIITGDDRIKPHDVAPTDEERAKLHRTLTAYAGTYTVEADKVIHHVDISWDEAWTGTNQIRFYKLDGNTLTITSAPNKSPVDGREDARFWCGRKSRRRLGKRACHCNPEDCIRNASDGPRRPSRRFASTRRSEGSGMTAPGTKRTCSRRQSTSAFGGKPDSGRTFPECLLMNRSRHRVPNRLDFEQYWRRPSLCDVCSAPGCAIERQK